ncbi:MAG: site-specific DNA-methyltransferase [Armatimonadetes bacterium]|nr:site-specific DNA-methyltransferase [Armatimonadota bacterium]
MEPDWVNQLYFGDNLDILRRGYIPDASVDLIYLDPPFNSNATYNVLFKEKDGTDSVAQVKGFEDFWHWDMGAEATYRELVSDGPPRVSQLMQALRQFLGSNDMMAYLTMMAIRLVELRRVLKSTGSIYLHCDDVAGHYLKLLMDAVFGPRLFLNEIIWKRTFSHGNVGRNYGAIYDYLLVYTKSATYTWNQVYTPFSEEYIERTFKHQDPDGRRWQSVTLRNPGERPNLRYPYKASNGVTYQPHRNGWVCNIERLRQYDREGRLHFPETPEGALRLKMYLDESSGIRLQNIWDDIPPIGSQASERLGYPTQKPQALLERIIGASSNEGGVVLDPFCGCGTTVAAAEKLHRRWIGIDITHLAIALMKHRLHTAFEGELSEFRVIGEPQDLASARRLAEENRHQFEYWALGLVDARPAGEPRKGADRGIDGNRYFFDDNSGKAKRCILQVKSGKVEASHIRDLKGVMGDRAEMAALITLEPPTHPMRTEAAEAGFYHAGGLNLGKPVPRVQILTIGGLLSKAERLELPQAHGEATFKRAPRQRKAKRGSS